MGRYRQDLPQLSGDFFLTDGGIETTLIFHDGLDLPYFASFDLLKNEEGRETLRRYFRTHAAVARDNGVGFILESATWRASPDWAEKLGYTSQELAEFNRQAIELCEEIRAEFENDQTKMVISGCVGPRGDGYNPAELMTADAAEAYHAEQVETFKDSAADLITGVTMTTIDEAVGLTRAAQKADVPVVISFTVETDGRLITGHTIEQAINAVDEATDEGPVYFMINCAHPTHFDHALEAGETWVNRIRGLRCNASDLSHAELDEAEELDDGDPQEFGSQHRALRDRLGHFNIFGGCCGTDHRHVEAVFHACAAPKEAAA